MRHVCEVLTMPQPSTNKYNVVLSQGHKNLGH